MLFENGLAQAARSGDARDLSRFHAGIGLCESAEGRYSSALSEFQAARDWALKAKSLGADLYASASNNLGIVYARMGDFDSAQSALRDGLAARPSREQEALLRLNRAIGYTDSGQPVEAEKALLDAIGRFRQTGDRANLGRALERLGYHLTRQRRLDEAEPFLRESQQIRPGAESADPYFVLAQLRLAQGRLGEASEFLEKYVASGRRHYWSGRVHNTRGRILEAGGQLTAALKEYRTAVDAMRTRRLHIRPSERLLRFSETALPELYEDYIRLASLLHRRTGDPSLLAEAMAASTEIRVAFQREHFQTPERWAAQHAEYRRLLAKLDALDAQGVRPDDRRADQVRLALVEYEGRMAADEPLLVPPPFETSRLLPQLRAMTQPDEAVFVFHITEQTSIGWLVTRERVSAAEMPPAAVLRGLTERFVKGLKTNNLPERAAGEELFTKIFREFFPAADTKLHWSLVLDGPLFDIPWAALPVPASKGGKTLIDRHAISLMPSFFPEWRSGRKEVKRLFAGVGDPVYNSADPRFAGPAPSPDAEMARLPGTDLELRQAADVWAREGYRAEIRTGAEASSAQLVETLAQRPAVLHLATHVVADAGPEPRLAFSLRNGRRDLLGARELSLLRAPGAMVMMAGCASGGGTPQPVGLVGLTRAWLLSGAEGVVATLWPVPDGQTEFPASFYARVSEITKQDRTNNGSRRLAWARALRHAVLEARDSARLPASVWAGYYLMGRT